MYGVERLLTSSGTVKFTAVCTSIIVGMFSSRSLIRAILEEEFVRCSVSCHGCMRMLQAA